MSTADALKAARTHEYWRLVGVGVPAIAARKVLDLTLLGLLKLEPPGAPWDAEEGGRRFRSVPHYLEAVFRPHEWALILPATGLGSCNHRDARVFITSLVAFIKRAGLGPASPPEADSRGHRPPGEPPAAPPVCPTLLTAWPPDPTLLARCLAPHRPATRPTGAPDASTIARIIPEPDAGALFVNISDNMIPFIVL